MAESPEHRQARLARKLEATAAQILTPDNYDLFDLVSYQLNQRNPVIPIEATARGLGVSVDALCRWVIGFRERRTPAVLPQTNTGLPRDPELRAELLRLRRRESSLVTIATEAPAQLERVQRRIESLERTH